MVKTLRNLAVVFAAATVGVSAMAQDLTANLVSEYTGELSVSVNNGTPTTSEATIELTRTAASTVTLNIKNFILGDIDNDGIAVGNIVVDGVRVLADEDDKVKFQEFSREIELQNGDMEGVDANEWQGVSLTNATKTQDKPEGGKYAGIPVSLNSSSANDEGLALTLTVYFPSLKQNISVVFTGDAANSAKNLATAIESIAVGEGVVEIYSIIGAYVGNNLDDLKTGVYIVKQNGKAQKVVVK